MIKKMPLIAFAAMSACAVPISSPAPVTTFSEPVIEPTVNPQSAKERFLQAAEANGCEVNAQTAPAILAGATLSETDLARILSELKADGLGGIASDGQSFRVNTGACA